MNHTHGAHARHTGRLARVLSLPASTSPAQIAGTMAQQLAAKLEAGNLRRLPDHELVEMRALVMALASLADRLETEEQRMAPERPHKWWQWQVTLSWWHLALLISATQVGVAYVAHTIRGCT